jgi:hypothetical protein
MRWLMPAIAGVNPALAGAALKVVVARGIAKLAILFGSQAGLTTAFKNYVAALIDYQRLACLKSFHRTATQAAMRSCVESKSGFDVFAPENAGLHPIEAFQGTKFRWSEPAAIMPIQMPVGQHRICIEFLPVRPWMHRADLRFYFNEKPLPACDVSIGPETIEIKLDLRQSGDSTLAWTCCRFPAAGDRRRLGLPIKRIVCHTVPNSCS